MNANDKLKTRISMEIESYENELRHNLDTIQDHQEQADGHQESINQLKKILNLLNAVTAEGPE